MAALDPKAARLTQSQDWLLFHLRRGAVISDRQPGHDCQPRDKRGCGSRCYIERRFTIHYADGSCVDNPPGARRLGVSSDQAIPKAWLAGMVRLGLLDDSLSLTELARAVDLDAVVIV